MKKILLVAALFGAVHAGTAQSSHSKKAIKSLDPAGKAAVNDVGGINPFKHKIPSAGYGEKAVTEIQIGTSYNCYSILLDGQNQVSYHQDIDAVSFIHRQNDGGTGGSGVLSFDVSTDGGATWSIDQGPLTPAHAAGTSSSFGNRYPSAAIYNPSGNTVADSAYIVGHGPSLQDDGTGSPGWGKIFEVSAKLDASNVRENYSNNTTDSTDFHPYGVIATPNGAFSISTRYNNSGNTNMDTLTYSEFWVNKGTYNSTNNRFDWTVSTNINPDWHQYMSTQTGALANLASGWNIAFGPSGNIGYAVAIGVEQGTTLPKTPRPILWKTTDGGATWTKLPKFDFSTLSPLNNYVQPASNGEIRPYFSSFDVTVDQNGALHLFTELLSGFSAHPDSLTFIYTHRLTRSLFDVTTTDGSNWQSVFIDSVHNFEGDYDGFAIDSRVQASRTSDGSKVFFTWLETDYSTTADSTNNFPDIHGRGLDPNTGNMTQPKQFTSNFGSYFATASPISITNGDDHKYEIPLVYADLSGGSTLLDPPQYTYVKGAGFDDSDFLTSVKENVGERINVDVYPVPTEGVLNVSLGNANHDFNIEVYDVVGKKVEEQFITSSNRTQVNLEGNDPGVYFVKVRVDNDITTKKVILH